jgi:hypothetical protein
MKVVQRKCLVVSLGSHYRVWHFKYYTTDFSWNELAGYLGSSFIGACLIACGFDTDASKVASLVLAVFFLFTLWWARKNML